MTLVWVFEIIYTCSKQPSNSFLVGDIKTCEACLILDVWETSTSALNYIRLTLLYCVHSTLPFRRAWSQTSVFITSLRLPLFSVFSFPSLATGGRTASVQNGANINAKDMPKMTALHRVAQRSHREVAELPLRYEADIDCLSKFHETPLDIAMDTSNTELMILLQVDGRMDGGGTH